MSITLVDGLPIWEGQAVRFGSPGRTLQGRYFVKGIQDGMVCVDHGHFTDPGALVCDLAHRPTFLEATIRIIQAAPDRYLGIDADGIVEFIDGAGETVTIGFDNPAALLALWQEVCHG